ncbi:Bax inhibitor-1 family protein [Gallaecimonas mangrovi]|uniref:Bax inhibitor-1 family protein n=1 Tax=Gallaecimonas mangrovi TaxID=2291597 RepID=UPI000E20601E|nr:Bax inhibitor-1 family protein [Gallaecimonas mangrovi]
MEVSVFKRRETSDALISAPLYNFVIGLTLAWGLLANWWMVTHIDPYAILSINPMLLFIGYFVCCFAGIYLCNKSDNPWVSFLGYNLVVVPFGFVINLVVAQYDPQVVIEAVRVTGLVTIGMMAFGTLFPAFFARIGGALTIALLLVIVVELVEAFVFKMHHGILDWIVALIFCGYIGYDWGRANSIPKTVDNAIDSAAALYIDIINLFLRVLRILGRR